MQKLSSTINLINHQLLAALLISLFFIACKKEPAATPPVNNPSLPSVLNAQFTGDIFTLAENAGETSYQLTLSASAAKAETIGVSVSSSNAQYGRDFTTTPAAADGKITIPVERGMQAVQLKIIPVNNNMKDGVRELQFTINGEGSIKPGISKTKKVILADDDTKASVAFLKTTASVSEAQTQGYTAELFISPLAYSDGFIEISYSSVTASYGTHFTTEPAAVNGKLRLAVQQNQSKITFKIKPVNDAVISAARSINFQIASTSPELESGIQKQLSLSITEDDVLAPVVTPIQTLRNSFNGTDTYFFPGTYITGIVTSVNDNIAPAVVYIQDGTGGIALRFTTTNQFLPGDLLLVDIQGALLGERNGVLEINQLQQSSAVKTGTDILVVPSTTITQLYTTPGNKEGQIVHLTNVTFTQANGTATLQGDRIISDGIRTALVRTESFASFSSRIIPAGRVSVTGILIEQNNQYIILPLTSQSIQ